MTTFGRQHLKKHVYLRFRILPLVFHAFVDNTMYKSSKAQMLPLRHSYIHILHNVCLKRARTEALEMSKLRASEEIQSIRRVHRDCSDQSENGMQCSQAMINCNSSPIYFRLFFMTFLTFFFSCAKQKKK